MPPTLPAPLAIWPVTRSVPLSAVVMVSASLRPDDRKRPARERPADVGLAEQLGQRIVALAGELARRTLLDAHRGWR